MKPEQVGVINQQVIKKLGLSIKENTPIMLGETNIEHMKSEHPDDFEKYFNQLKNILSAPDYIAKHPKKPSIEYTAVDYPKLGILLPYIRAYSNKTAAISDFHSRGSCPEKKRRTNERKVRDEVVRFSVR